MADILVVDDDQSIAKAFEHFLTYEGHHFRLASSGSEGLEMIEQARPAVVFMDVRMPGLDGVTALKQMRERFPDLCVVIMTAYGTSQTSIDAIRAGAFDYLTKPLDLDELRAIITKALAAQRATGDSAEALSEPIHPSVNLVGETPGMMDVYKMIGRLATNTAPATVFGERGTGKHLIVATIHQNSPLRDKPLISLACESVSESDLDAALFDADAGTVELMAVHRLPLALQTRVAQALAAARESGAGRRLAARVIATSEHVLADDVRDGSFSRELHDEVAVITLRLQPLRERRDDIPLLVRHFLQRFNVDLNRSIRSVDEPVLRKLQAHMWPGNVGQLERVIKRACIVARGDIITADDVGEGWSESAFPERPGVRSVLDRVVRTALQDRLVQADGPGGSPFHDIVDAVEATLVDEALTITNGNQVKASDLLGVNRATLRKKMSTGS